MSHFTHWLNTLAVKDVDLRKLRRMTAIELALERTKYEEHDPRYVLAEDEAERRLLSRQIRAAYYIAAITAFATLIAITVQLWMTFHPSPVHVVIDHLPNHQAQTQPLHNAKQK